MDRFRLISAFVFFLMTAVPSFPYPSAGYASFSSIGVSDGLSQNDVTAITQDKTGFLWFGTRNGLNRYDGYGFVTFKQDFEDDGALGSSIISSLAAASDGSVWVGTLSGLSRYFPSDGSFRRYGYAYRRDGVRQELNQISDIYISPDMDTYVLSGNNLSIYDEENDVFHTYAAPASGKDMLTSITYYDSGRLWVGSEAGLFIFSIYDGTFHPLIPGRPLLCNDSLQADLRIYSLVTGDSPDELILGTNQGVLKYCHLDGTLGKVKCKGTELGRIETLFRSSDGRIWVGAQRQGLYLLEGDILVPFLHDVSDPLSISSDKILSLFQDRSGVLWVGTLQGGVNKLDMNSRRYRIIRPDILSADDPIVLSVLKEDKYIWMGVGDGVLERIDLQTGDRRSWNLSFPDRHYAYDLGQIMDIDKEGGDILWLSTGKGLFRFDKRTGYASPVDIMLPMEDPSYVYPNLINGIEFDKDGNMWCCSPSGIFILKDGKLIRHIVRGSTPDRLPRNNIQTIYMDRSGTVWVATRDGGLSRFTGTVDEPAFVTYRRSPEPGSLSHDNVCSIYEDSKGRLWIGTWGGGLNLMDRDSGTFETFTVKDGLLDNVIFGIAEDPEGLIWLSTYQGLSCIDPDTGAVSNYIFPGIGKNGETVFSRISIDSSGILYVCRLDGLMQFDTGYTEGERSLLPPVVTSFEIYGKPALPYYMPGLDNIGIRYNDKHFSIGFASFDYTSEGVYSYMLEGIDKDWIETGRHTVNYSNLSPGEYRFMLRFSDGYGNSSGEVCALTIKVKPPFYATVYAYFIYCMSAVAASLYAVRYFYRKNRARQERIAEELKLSSEKELYNAKMTFFTNMSHELRTPLTLILGPVQRLKAALDGNEELLQMIGIMENNGERLLRIVNQFLDFRKIETGNAVMEIKETDLSSLVARVAGYFEDMASRKHISVNIDTPGTILLRTDADKVEKILYNLMSNAVKFTESTIDIYIEADSSHLGISVADNGKGIPAGEHEKIFTRFYQIDKSSDGGSGIGLNLSKELARLLGGDLTVRSGACGGSVFCLSLPPDGLRIVSGRHESSVTSCDAGGSGEKPCIMVVDDNAEMRFFIKTALGSEYMVVEASDGLGAEKMLEKYAPDLIISDIMMPEVDGIELTRFIRESRKTYNIPIMIVTARASEEDRLECLEAGADAYITKPFSGQYLRLQAEKIMQLQQKAREQLQLELLTKPGDIQIKSPAHKMLRQVAELLEQNISDPDFNVEQLCNAMHLSRMHIYRLLKNTVGESPGEFIKNFRLARAAALLEEGGLNINEISYRVGFNDPKWFSTCFKKKYGVSPGKYSKS